MSKYTLLQISQEVASSMDSDEFDSINDTTESLQIANVVRRAYYDMLTTAGLPEDSTPYNLTETSASTPTRMTIPSTHKTLDYLKYNVETLTDTDQDWRSIRYLSWIDFHDMMSMLDESNTDDVGTYSLTVGSATVPIMYSKTSGPQYYTTYDDASVLFDAVDTDTETFLRTTKTLGFGKKLKSFTMSDSFTPEIDEDQFPLLINEAKSLAWAELKQTTHSKAEQSARRQKISQQIGKKAIKGYTSFQELANFGRK